MFAQTASDYYLPLRTGNYLEYTTPGNGFGWEGRTTKEYIAGTDSINGHLYYKQIGTETTSSGTSTFHVFWLRKDPNGAILLGGFSDTYPIVDSAYIIEPAAPFFTNQHLVPGYTQQFDWGKDSVMSKTELVQTPAGTFQNCVKVMNISYDDSGKVKNREYASYAAGVGIVKIVRDFPFDEVHTNTLMQFVNLLSVAGQNHFAPNTCLLEQNYPNPFNPSTTIRYAIPSAAHVRLTIHDLLGRDVATIVNELQTEGWKEAVWNAGASANGIYFYRLTAGTYTMTKTMVLLK
jgi:hypothetical protein